MQGLKNVSEREYDAPSMLMYAVRLLNQYPKQKLVIYLAPMFSIIRPEYNFLELAGHDVRPQSKSVGQDHFSVGHGLLILSPNRFSMTLNNFAVM